MQAETAMAILLEGIEQSGLADKGWSAGWDRARLRFGACWPKRKQITLSRVLTELNDEAQVRDTVLHELAHALAFERYGRVRSHGPEWKAIAQSLGASPRACSATGLLPKGRYALVHRTTGEVYRTYQRKPRRTNLQGRYIQGRKAETLKQLQVIEL
jgi:predicted SprT family Zn-dependent metalloprotease